MERRNVRQGGTWAKCAARFVKLLDEMLSLARLQKEMFKLAKVSLRVRQPKARGERRGARAAMLPRAMQSPARPLLR